MWNQASAVASGRSGYDVAFGTESLGSIPWPLKSDTSPTASDRGRSQPLHFGETEYVFGGVKNQPKFFLIFIASHT